MGKNRGDAVFNRPLGNCWLFNVAANKNGFAAGGLLRADPIYSRQLHLLVSLPAEKTVFRRWYVHEGGLGAD